MTTNANEEKFSTTHFDITMRDRDLQRATFTAQFKTANTFVLQAEVSKGVPSQESASVKIVHKRTSAPSGVSATQVYHSPPRIETLMTLLRTDVPIAIEDIRPDDSAFSTSELQAAVSMDGLGLETYFWEPIVYELQSFFGD